MRKTILVTLACFILSVVSVCYANFTPQVTVTDTQKKEVQDVFVAQMLKNGWSVKNVNEYTVTFVRNTSNFWGSVFTGSTSFEYRSSFNFMQTGNDVLVTGTAQAVSFPGTAREEIIPADQKTNESIQVMLNGMRNSFCGAYLWGFDCKKKSDNYAKIEKVTPGGAFEKAGIKENDKIISINGKLISDMNDAEFDKSLEGGKGTKAIFIIEHNDKQKAYTIEKQFYPPTIQRQK